MTQRDWKGIPGREEHEQVNGTGRMSTVLKNGSKSNWAEHKVYMKKRKMVIAGLLAQEPC